MAIKAVLATSRRKSSEDKLADCTVAPDGRGAEPRLLAVGEPRSLQLSASGIPRDANVIFAHFANLSRAHILAVRPDVVLSPLVSEGFDCLELAIMLHAWRFGGEFWIAATRLPRPSVVLNEIRNSCPGLKVECIVEDLVAPAQFN